MQQLRSRRPSRTPKPSGNPIKAPSAKRPQSLCPAMHMQLHSPNTSLMENPTTFRAMRPGLVASLPIDASVGHEPGPPVAAVEEACLLEERFVSISGSTRRERILGTYHSVVVSVAALIPGLLRAAGCGGRVGEAQEGDRPREPFLEMHYEECNASQNPEVRA